MDKASSYVGLCRFTYVEWTFILEVTVIEKDKSMTLFIARVMMEIMGYSIDAILKVARQRKKIW